MGIYVSISLPILEFLHKSTCFVFSALHRFLQGMDDSRYFSFLLGFLSEDEGIRDVGIRRRKWCDILDLFGLGMSVGGVVFVEVDHSEIVDVIDHDFIKNAWARGAVNCVGKQRACPTHPYKGVGTYFFCSISFADLFTKEYAL